MKTVLYLDMWVGERIQEMKLAGIRRFARMADWDVIPVGEAASRPRKLRALLKKHKPDGIIVECSAAHRDLPPRRFGATPVVYLDCSRTLYGNSASRVIHDGKATMKAVFRELSSNRPDAYAFVGYRLRRTWSTFRERAFKTLVKEAGADCRVFPHKSENDQMRQSRLAKWLGELPKKTAVFAANDMTALEVLAAAKRCRREVPKDFSLMGVDNLEEKCEASSPTLTSIQVDFERAGYLAAKLLEDVMAGRASAGSVAKFGPLLTVHRQSTRGYGRAEPRILSAMELIRREACNGLTAEDVTKLFAGSRRLVELRFRETLGHSILDEIQNVRMEKVQFLLSKTDTPIGAIAAQCGYRSDIALRKAFRLLTGKSLADWRKANRAIRVFPHPPASGGGFPRPRPV